MSAFVVDTTCMDRVVRGFDLAKPNPTRSDLFRTMRGQDLFNLNIEAVRQRYGDDDMVPDGWSIEDYQYTPPPDVPGVPQDVDSLKALHCLIYQCSEGDVPERRLYQLLVEISQKLEARIRAEHGADDIHDLPAYQRAEW
jgi:hypothetical protein